jgi:hypothetical protein
MFKLKLLFAVEARNKASYNWAPGAGIASQVKAMNLQTPFL